MSYTIERVIESVTLGEGPHWDAQTQTLYFVDVVNCTINKYDSLTNKHVKASLDQSPSFIIPIQGTPNKFLVSMLLDLTIVTWDGISSTVSNIEKVVEVDENKSLKNMRLNDGKVDFTGRLWAGTFSTEGSLEEETFPGVGSIISFSPNRQLKYHINDIHIANGLAWNEELQKFYYIDSQKKAVDQFDYDVKNETISNRQTIFSLNKHNLTGYPDGQAIDTDGNLWIALFNGGKVIKINPRRPETLLQTIDMPAPLVTSVAFGGKNLDELYVTTARGVFINNSPLTPADGATYRITGLGAKGFDGVPFKLENLAV